MIRKLLFHLFSVSADYDQLYIAHGYYTSQYLRERGVKPMFGEKE